MVTIDLVDLLTASLSFLGGAVGGFVVVFLESRARRTEERRRTVEEFRALLLLVGGEISSNHKNLRYCKSVFEKVREALAPSEAEALTLEEILEDMPSLSSIFSTASKVLVSTATWDSTKVRIAHLLDTEKIESLVDYYNEIFSISPVLSTVNLRDKNDVDWALDVVLGDLIAQGDRTLKLIEGEIERAKHLSEELQAPGSSPKRLIKL